MFFSQVISRNRGSTTVATDSGGIVILIRRTLLRDPTAGDTNKTTSCGVFDAYAQEVVAGRIVKITIVKSQDKSRQRNKNKNCINHKSKITISPGTILEGRPFRSPRTLPIRPQQDPAKKTFLGP